MALRANEGAHFSAAGEFVWIVWCAAVGVAPALDRWERSRIAFRLGEGLNALDEAWASHAELHGFGVVAVDARDRMRVAHVVHHAIEFFIRHLVSGLETCHCIAIAQLAIDRHDGCVAV